MKSFVSFSMEEILHTSSFFFVHLEIQELDAFQQLWIHEINTPFNTIYINNAHGSKYATGKIWHKNTEVKKK